MYVSKNRLENHENQLTNVEVIGEEKMVSLAETNNNMCMFSMRLMSINIQIYTTTIHVRYVQYLTYT